MNIFLLMKAYFLVSTLSNLRIEIVESPSVHVTTSSLKKILMHSSVAIVQQLLMSHRVQLEHPLIYIHLNFVSLIQMTTLE